MKKISNFQTAICLHSQQKPLKHNELPAESSRPVKIKSQGFPKTCLTNQRVSVKSAELIMRDRKSSASSLPSELDRSLRKSNRLANDSNDG